MAFEIIVMHLQAVGWSLNLNVVGLPLSEWATLKGEPEEGLVLAA